MFYRWFKMVGEIRKLVFLEGVTVTNPTDGKIEGDYRAGSVALSIGESSKTIAFTSAMPDALYVPVVSIESSDSNPNFLNFVIKNKTVNGFDVVLNGPADSANYKINYRAGVLQ
jgi:hypothetical protein